MKKWFYYVFYRAAKYYEGGWEKDGVYRGGLVATMSVCCILLSIIVFVMHVWFDKEINTKIALGAGVATVICSLFFTRKKYEQLAEKYKDEKNSKLKGWLVVIYAVGTFVLYGASMIICGYWVEVTI